MENWKQELFAEFQSRYGTGKCGSNAASIRIVITDIEAQIEANKSCPDVNLRRIQHNFLKKILEKAQNDLTEATK